MATTPPSRTFFFHLKPCPLSLQNWECLCLPTMNEWYGTTTYAYPHGSKLCPLTATVRKLTLSWTKPGHTIRILKTHEFWNPNTLYKLKNSSKFSFLISINVHENNWWANISSQSLIKVHCKRISLANWITVLFKFLLIQIKFIGGKQPHFHNWTEKHKDVECIFSEENLKILLENANWWFCVSFGFYLWCLHLLQNIDGMNIQVTRLGCSLVFLNYSIKAASEKADRDVFSISKFTGTVGGGVTESLEVRCFLLNIYWSW